MSVTASMPRAPRARVLLVGSDQGMNDLADRIEAPMLRSGNLFDALGHVASSSAAEPVCCIIISDQVLLAAPGLWSTSENSGIAIAESFRKLDPSVRIVLCMGQEGEGGGAFDAVITAAATTQQIQDALGVPIREVQRTVDEPAATLSVQSPADESPSEDLGDVDLVEAVLAGQSLSDRALQLIRGQTGWRSLRLSDEPGGAPVALEGRDFGRLHCDQASLAQLEPWAAWLARWLSLESVHREFRTMAYQDELTGAGNRRACDRFLINAIASAYQRRRPVTVMVFDIDNFKHYNDRYGHGAGDDILRETIKLLNSVIRKGDHVFRIGGDEFAVVFADPEGPRERGSQPPVSIDQIAGRFQQQVCRLKFPKLGPEAPGTLSISAGLATYPWDGQDPRTLLDKADELAMQSKRGGKNAITFGPAAAEICKLLDDHDHPVEPPAQAR